MTIVAAVGKEDPNRRVVVEGHRLAEAFDEPLHVIHVISTREFVDIETANVERSGRAVETETLRARAAEVAAAAAKEVTDDFEAVGRIGTASTKVLEYVDSQDASYLVIGGRKRTPAGKVIFGSVTQSILLNSVVPVVTVMAAREDEY